MIILMNCLTDAADEGGVKLANRLAKHMKKLDPAVTLLSYGGAHSACDVHIPVNNKLMMNSRLARYLLRKKEPVLYFPAYTRMRDVAVHTFVLSLFARHGLQTVMVMRSAASPLAKLLLRLSRTEMIALSKESWQELRGVIGDRAIYLRTGVDTERFHLVDDGRKAALREKYGVPTDAPVVLHVGHMKAGRNIGQLLKLNPRFHVLLLTSTQTAGEQDTALRSQLEARPNTTIIDRYLPAVEEIYQLADVYFFPVEAPRNCIDAPLSALEAAACGLPVAATPYGELKQLMDTKGFYPICSFEEAELNELLCRAVQEGQSPRENVLAYDWKYAAARLLQAGTGRMQGDKT